MPDGLVEKTSYDALVRVNVDYVTDGGGDSSYYYSDALNVNGDIVYSQTEYTYDLNNNVIETVDREQVAGETGTGPLGTPTTGVKARVTYAGAYYDAADRLTAVLDVGTNGGTVWTLPSTVPSSSDSVHVTSYSYGTDGLLQDVTDPRGITTHITDDLLGRVTSSTAAYGTSDAFTTSLAYDSGGHLLSVTRPGSQTTQYGYDLYGQVNSVTERVGTAFQRTTTIVADNVGVPVSVTDPAGATGK